MYENIAVANINTEVNGIELTFDGKPPYDVLKDLKENGFRWHNKKKIWYAKNNPDNVKAVMKYVDLEASDKMFGITPLGNVDVGSAAAVEGDVYRYLVVFNSNTKDIVEKLGSDAVRYEYPMDMSVNEKTGLTTYGYFDFDKPLDINTMVGYNIYLEIPPIVNGATGKKYQFGFGSFGNGTTVWNRLDYDNETHDYKTVAHISDDGTIVFMENDLPQEAKDFIARSDKEGIYKLQLEMLEKSFVEEKGKNEALNTELADKKPVKAPCLADFYDRVGGIEVCRNSDVKGSLWSMNRGVAYYEDLNVKIRCFEYGLTVTELDNAMKRGKECKVYTLYLENTNELIHNFMSQKLHIANPRELVEFLKSGDTVPDGAKIDTRFEKSVETFSPFVSVKPLEQAPAKWRKADLVRGIMSGQVFDGTLQQRLTDDYAYDAAYNFGEGRKLDLTRYANDLVGGHDGCYLSCDGLDENGYTRIHYSYGGDYIEFLFDVNCDLAESRERAEKAHAELIAHNEEIKNSVIKVDVESINPDKIYFVEETNKDPNTGKLGIKPFVVQGFELAENLDLHDIIGYKEVDLSPTMLYQVANFFCRRDYAEEDFRIVDMGNWGQLSSGKAIKELTRDGVSLSLTPASIEHPVTFEQAKKDCMEFINGTQRFLFGNDVDYSQSLKKLEAEELRVSEPEVIVTEGKVSSTKKAGLDSIIGFAELKKEFEKNLKVDFQDSKKDDLEKNEIR